MKPHRFDPLSFVFGIAFLVLAGAVTIGDFDPTQGEWVRWGATAMLLLFGVLMLATSRTRGNRT